MKKSEVTQSKNQKLGAHIKGLGNRDEQYGNVDTQSGLPEVDKVYRKVSGGGSPGSAVVKKGNKNLGSDRPGASIEDQENEDVEIDEGIENGAPRKI